MFFSLNTYLTDTVMVVHICTFICLGFINLLENRIISKKLMKFFSLVKLDRAHFENTQNKLKSIDFHIMEHANLINNFNLNI